MAFSAKLALKQSQSLVMTPQLQQAIKLLQLSNVELARYLEQELERNPILERGESDGDNPISYSTGGVVDSGASTAAASDRDGAVGASASERVGTDDGAAASTSEATETTASIDDASFGSEAIETMGSAWEGGDSSDVEVGSAVAFENWGNGSTHKFDDEYDFEGNLVSEVSFRERIGSQINIEFEDASDRGIAFQLFEAMDEAGYLTGDMNRLAATVGCRLSRVETVLARLQKFDPPGIFARDLVECLTIQLDDLGELDLSFQIILENLDLVAQGDWAKLMRLTRITEDDLRERIGVIKSLQPKPALSYETQNTQAVIPDVILRPAPSGGWIVELNAQNLPRVLVNNAYAARINTAPSLSGRDREFLIEQTQSANWLVKALQQRATTILKVSTSIVQTQEEFFAKGVQYLRPLVLRDIAERVGIHESTVSRVTNNKFIQTPRGMYELKYFFTASIAAASEDGAAHSAEAVRHRIKLLIDNEDKKKILSDDTIVKVLKQDGVDIARRTVAKYREAMRIPSSVQRRRQKAMA